MTCTDTDLANIAMEQGHKAFIFGDFAQAARDYCHAAEMYQRASWAASRSLNSPGAKLAKDCLVEACIKRDNTHAA